MAIEMMPSNSLSMERSPLLMALSITYLAEPGRTRPDNQLMKINAIPSKTSRRRGQMTVRTAYRRVAQEGFPAFFFSMNETPVERRRVSRR